MPLDDIALMEIGREGIIKAYSISSTPQVYKKRMNQITKLFTYKAFYTVNINMLYCLASQEEVGTGPFGTCGLRDLRNEHISIQCIF